MPGVWRDLFGVMVLNGKLLENAELVDLYGLIFGLEKMVWLKSFRCMPHRICGKWSWY